MKTETWAGLVLPALAGCATVTSDYVGETYPPTEHVDVFYAASEITSPYKVMGRAGVNVPADAHFREGKAQEQILAQARARGADAVLFTEAEKTHTSSFGSGGYRSHKRVRYETLYTASFLKYR